MSEIMQSHGVTGALRAGHRGIVPTGLKPQVMAFLFIYLFMKQGLDIWMAQTHATGAAPGAGDQLLDWAALYPVLCTQTGPGC